MENLNEPLLEVNNIDVSHGSFQALWDVSLAIWPNEIVTLIGANTAGKSTLLDSISGFLHPSTGNITFKGKEISSLDPFKIVELGITQVPEGRRIFPNLNVLENLIIGSYNRKARHTRKENLNKVFTLFPILQSRKEQMAKTLSGGEQQMLALGRGLMSNPTFMLLDEMSLGLAPVVLDVLYNALRDIRNQGITILFVEQNVRRSLEEADRAYIMESGRIVLSSNSSELHEEEMVKKAYFGI